MAGRAGRERGRAGWLASGILVVAAATSPPAHAQDGREGRPGHLRATDGQAARLLAAGTARSATIRGLVATLERSDLIVYIQTGQLAIPGHTAFLAAAPGARLVRITISDAPDMEDRRLAWLGHELQHAVEVASNPTIVSAAAMRRFLREQGFQVSETVYCTKAAQDVTRAVGYEVATNRPHGRRP